MRYPLSVFAFVFRFLSYVVPKSGDTKTMYCNTKTTKKYCWFVFHCECYIHPYRISQSIFVWVLYDVWKRNTKHESEIRSRQRERERGSERERDLSLCQLLLLVRVHTALQYSSRWSSSSSSSCWCRGTRIALLCDMRSTQPHEYEHLLLKIISYHTCQAAYLINRYTTAKKNYTNSKYFVPKNGLQC